MSDTRRLFGIVYFKADVQDAEAMTALDAMTRELPPEQAEKIDFMYLAFAENGDLPKLDEMEDPKRAREAERAE